MSARSSIRKDARGALLALLAYAIFATHDVLVKYLGGHYVAFQIVFFSVLLSFPLLALMLMRDTSTGNLRPRHPWWTALRTAAAVTAGSSIFYAFSVLPMAQVYAILFAAPLLITVLAIPILGERVGPYRGGAVVVGLLGVLVVLRPGSSELQLGHLAALTGAVGTALASIIVRKIGHAERSAVLLVYPMMANFVLMLFLMPLVYRPMPIEHLALVGAVSLLAFTAGLCVIAAYRTGDAAVVAPMQYSQIIWAAVYGFVFFGEELDLFTVLGAAIVISSGIYIVVRESLGLSLNAPVIRGRTRVETATTPRIGIATMRGLPGRAQAPLAMDSAAR